MKFRISTLALTLSLFALLLAGCQSGQFCLAPKGDEVTQTISIADFDGIELGISGNVTLHRDSVQRVEVTGHANIIENLERNVKNGVWIIEFDQCVRKTGNLEIHIWLPNLKTVKLAGSGNITGLDLFEGGSSLDVALTGSGNISLAANASVVSASIAGSGNLELSATADQLEADITGSGYMRIDGSCSHETMRITGSGDIHGFDLLSETASIDLTGSGRCEAQISNHLDAQISGSGDIYYKGDATVSAQITGSGNVKHVN